MINAQKGKSQVVFENSEVSVIVPKDPIAACYYGQGPGWHSNSINDNQLNFYKIEGDLYIFLPKNPKYDGEKYKANFQSTCFMNESELSADPVWLLLKRFGDLSDVFKNLVPELNDWIVFASDSDIRGAVEAVAERADDYIYNRLVDDMCNNDYYHDWQDEQARELEYLEMPDGTEFEGTPEQLQQLEDEGLESSDLEVDEHRLDSDNELNDYLGFMEAYEWYERLIDSYRLEPQTIRELVEKNELIDGHIAKLKDIWKIVAMNVDRLGDEYGLAHWLYQSWNEISKNTVISTLRNINMHNHDKLYNWWWSDAGPRNSAQMSIEEIVEILNSQRYEIYDWEDRRFVTNNGWHYAVKRFLIIYCNMSNAERNIFNATDNYSIWTHHLNAPVSVMQLKEA